MTGILDAILCPLAVEKVPVCVTSNYDYDTDYFLVWTEHLACSVQVLEKAGHRIRWEGNRKEKGPRGAADG